MTDKNLEHKPVVELSVRTFLTKKRAGGETLEKAVDLMIGTGIGAG